MSSIHERLGSYGCNIEAVQSNEFILIFNFYVDDLIILTNILKIIDLLKIKLKKKYKMIDLKELHYCLGMEFVKDYAKKMIIIIQSKYIEDVLKRFNMKKCKPTYKPLEANLMLMKLIDEEFAKVEGQMLDIPY